jgi:hypothetical protein
MTLLVAGQVRPRGTRLPGRLKRLDRLRLILVTCAHPPLE